MKGIAILAMLFHHMYGAPPPEVEPYTGILVWIGVLGNMWSNNLFYINIEANENKFRK